MHDCILLAIIIKMGEAARTKNKHFQALNLRMVPFADCQFFKKKKLDSRQST
jgi:hypothetical protein